MAEARNSSPGLHPLAWLVVAAVLPLFAWLGKSADDWSRAYSFTGQRDDYYNRLVDGFQAGQLHLDLPVHPDRLSPDPAVRARAPFALDASLFEGRYYLYYGVAPAVLLLWPYSAVTGHDLSLNVAVLAFVAAGFLFSVAWLRGLKRQWRLSPSATGDTAAVLLLAFGTGALFLVRRSMFYELPLAAGYAFLSVFVWTTTRALLHPAAATGWIAAGSAALGLAAGGHPNLALVCPVLALTAWWIWRDGPRTRARALRLAAAAVLPAAAIGAALAAYNWARFGDPLEFGFSYGENIFFTTGDRLLGLDFLWPNFRWYYLTPPSFAPFFPFVFPLNASFRPPGYHGAEAVHGLFAFTVLVVAVAAALLRARPTLPPGAGRLAVVLGASGAVSALCLMLFGIRANRYLVDFQLPAVGLAVLGLVLLPRARRRLSRAWGAGLLALTTIASTVLLGAAVQQFDDFKHTRPREFATASRLLNPSWAFWDRLGLVRTGTLELDVRFSPASQAVVEPLVTTGLPLYSDSVYVAQHPNGYLEILVDHHGFGGPRTGLLPYEVGRTYRIAIDLGSFVPPEGDPLVRDLDPSALRAQRRLARIRIDGETKLERVMAFHPSAPWTRLLGENPLTHKPYSPRFSGRILAHRWLPFEPKSVAYSGSVVRLHFRLDAGAQAANQPLLQAGTTGAGSLLLLKPVGPGRWSLAVDEWSYGFLQGPELEIDQGPSVMEVFVGPVARHDPSFAALDWEADDGLLARTLVVWLDGREAARFRLSAHLQAFGQVVEGENTASFSTATRVFAGQIARVPVSAAEEEAVARRLLPPAPHP